MILDDAGRMLLAAELSPDVAGTRGFESPRLQAHLEASPPVPGGWKCLTGMVSGAGGISLPARAWGRWPTAALGLCGAQSVLRGIGGAAPGQGR